jgi:hypothetical protein
MRTNEIIQAGGMLIVVDTQEVWSNGITNNTYPSALPSPSTHAVLGVAAHAATNRRIPINYNYQWICNTPPYRMHSARRPTLAQ